MSVEVLNYSSIAFLNFIFTSKLVRLKTEDSHVYLGTAVLHDVAYCSKQEKQPNINSIIPGKYLSQQQNDNNHDNNNCVM